MIISIFSLALGFAFLQYGINNQGVMLCIVGATLLLQGFSILVITPLYKEENTKKNDLLKDLISNYVSILEKSLADSTHTVPVYVPLGDQVKIILMNEESIKTMLPPIKDDLFKNMLNELDFSKYGSIENLTLALEKRLKENDLVKKLEYFIGDDGEYLRITEPATLEYVKYISNVAPRAFKVLGCPISSVLVGLISKYKKTALKVNFNLNGSIVEVKINPISL